MKRIAYLLPILLALAGCKKEEPFVRPITPVKLQAVERESPEEGPRYSGTVEPASRYDLAFRLGGFVEQIHTVGGRLVYEGDQVAKGTVLAKVRQSDYQVKVAQATSQLDQARAALAQTEEGVRGAKAGLDKAKGDFDRATALFAKESLTKSDMDGATAQLKGAQANYDGALTQLPLAKARIAGAQGLVDEANLSVKDTAILAPVDGIILKRLIEVGSLVGPGTPAFIMANLVTLKAVFGAPDILLGRLPVGTNVTFKSEALPGRQFSGRVSSIAPAADPRTRVFDVDITFSNPNMLLRPGMVVSLQLPAMKALKTEMASSLVIPMNAIVRTKAGTQGVFVVTESAGKATARSREIGLGGTLKNRIIVTSGLQEGERVIVAGASLVQDGEVVQIIP